MPSHSAWQSDEARAYASAHGVEVRADDPTRREAVERVHAILINSSIDDDLSGVTAERIVAELECMAGRLT